MIGVAGCGRMGAPMLSALRAAGLDAGGFDIRPPSEFGVLAPVMTRDLADFAARVTTLISVVRDIVQTDDVLVGAQGFASAPNLSRILICSTLSPRYVRSLRARLPDHITLIDAPMSGAQIAAQEARLSFMFGGEQAEAVAGPTQAGQRPHRVIPFEPPHHLPPRTKRPPNGFTAAGAAQPPQPLCPLLYECMLSAILFYYHVLSFR